MRPKRDGEGPHHCHSASFGVLAQSSERKYEERASLGQMHRVAGHVPLTRVAQALVDVLRRRRLVIAHV